MNQTVRRTGLIILASVLVFLCACTNSSNIDTGKLDELKKKMEENSTSDKAPEKPEKKTKKKKEEQKEEAPAGLFERAFADGDVENNGSKFVRVGNRVYFRTYNTRALSFTTLDVPDIDEVRTDLPSTLMYFDLDTDETVEVSEVYGIGDLYATTDGICIDSYPDGYASTTLIDENGNINENYLPANITGVSEDGRSMSVAEKDDEERIIPALYRDVKRVRTPADEGDDNRYYTELGFTGGSMTGITSGRGSQDKELFSYDENGLVILGTIGQYDMGTYTLSPNVEDITTTGDKGYVTAVYRDGTADAAVAWAVYDFAAGRKDSLKEYDSGEIGAKYGFAAPKVSIDADGSTRLSPYKLGEVYTDQTFCGDLCVDSGYGEEMILRENYISDPDGDREYVRCVEYGYCFNGDAAFFIEVNGSHFADDDMGVHRAYALGTLQFNCLRFDDAHMDENGNGKFFGMATEHSCGWDKGDIDHDRLVGEWEAYSVEVEGDHRLMKDEPLGDIEMIRFDSDGTAEKYFKDQQTGKISNKRPLYQDGPDEFMQADYAYVFYSYDPDPLRCGIEYLTHNKLAIFYLYHFDGNSTGTYEIVYNRVK